MTNTFKAIFFVSNCCSINAKEANGKINTSPKCLVEMGFKKIIANRQVPNPKSGIIRRYLFFLQKHRATNKTPISKVKINNRFMPSVYDFVKSVKFS